MFNNKYGNFIYHKKAAVSLKRCQDAITFFEDRLSDNNSSIPVEYRDDEIKKCIDMFVQREGFDVFEKALQTAQKEYYEKYMLPCFIRRFNLADVYKIQKYHGNDSYFTLHCEMNGDGCKEEQSRILAWMIYLNDVTDGGGQTEFPAQGKRFKARAGDLLMWPAYFTHPHKGIPSKVQTKYIATGWCGFTSFLTQ